MGTDSQLFKTRLGHGGQTYEPIDFDQVEPMAYRGHETQAAGMVQVADKSKQIAARIVEILSADNTPLGREVLYGIIVKKWPSLVRKETSLCAPLSRLVDMGALRVADKRVYAASGAKVMAYELVRGEVGIKNGNREPGTGNRGKQNK